MTTPATEPTGDGWVPEPHTAVVAHVTSPAGSEQDIHLGTTPTWSVADAAGRADYRRWHRARALEQAGTVGGRGWRVTFTFTPEPEDQP